MTMPRQAAGSYDFRMDTLSASENFARRLGLRHALIQAPMAGAQDHALAAAAMHAGALGSLPAALLAPQALRDEVMAARAAATGPLNLNFFAHRPPPPDVARE